MAISEETRHQIHQHLDLGLPSQTNKPRQAMSKIAGSRGYWQVTSVPYHVDLSIGLSKGHHDMAAGFKNGGRWVWKELQCLLLPSLEGHISSLLPCSIHVSYDSDICDTCVTKCRGGELGCTLGRENQRICRHF